MEERHEAVDGVLNLFSKANHDLTIVQNRLHKEFQQIYPPNVPLLHSQLLSSSILGKHPSHLQDFIFFSFAGKPNEVGI